MLPPAAYTAAEAFDWERRHFFGGGWTCAAHGSRLPSIGDQPAVETGNGGALLVRGEHGPVRAFANTCRHRGHQLLPCGSSATGKAIVCPYHSWATRPGELRGAPGYREIPGFDASAWPLVSLPTVEWHGLVFVDGSGGAAGPLPLAALDAIVAPYEPERLVVAASHRYDAAVNWKILTETYHERYHCPTIHPELCSVSPPHSGENYPASGSWIGGWMSLRDDAATMLLDGRSGGVQLRGCRAGRSCARWPTSGSSPNVLLSLHPDYVMTHILTPVVVDRTRIDCSWAFAPEAVGLNASFDPSYAVDFWDLTNRQDWAACEAVQRGLSSPFASPGPLSPEEDAIYSFVTTVARGYQGMRSHRADG